MYPWNNVRRETWFSSPSPSRNSLREIIDQEIFWGSRWTHELQARLIFSRIESADKWENFPEHFGPMPPPQNVSLRFRKGNVPFRSRAVLLYSRRAYSRVRLTMSNKPVFCAALNLSTRIGPLNFAHDANGAVFRFSIIIGRFYDEGVLCSFA